MENGLFARAAEFISRQRNMKRWQKVVTAMAAVVVFGTTYALILPAITLENNVFCGQEEHVHNAKCYDTQLICGQEEAKGHVHSDSCYQIETSLVCDLEETPGHTHTDACMTVESTLTCASTEEGHVHGDGCYTTTSTVTCGQAETAGHTHGDGCYMKNSVLICTESTEVPEGGHVHTDACYSQGKETICGKEEHKHNAACRSNHNADVESRDEWEKTMEDVELTGEFPADVLAIAESQLGYTESKTNYIYNEEQDRKLGYSRYGAWYGNAYGDWCAMFVSFCLHYAEISAEDFPREAGCQRWIEDLTELELYLEVEDHYPVPGDLIFFNWDEEPDSDHVGLVKEIILDKDGNPEKIKTIEGNSSNKVQHVTYQWGDDSIMGYGDLTKAYQLWLEKQEQEEAEDGADDQEEPQTLTFENDDLTLVASYGPEAGIPDDAELVVEPIEPGDLERDYIGHFRLAQAALNPQSEEEALEPESQDAQPEDGEEEEPEPEIQDFLLYDIKLKSQDQEITPLAPVTLKLTVPTPPQPEEGEEGLSMQVSLLQFDETGTEVPEVQPLVEEEPGELTTTFALRSDSINALAFTPMPDAVVLFDGRFGSHVYYSYNDRTKYKEAARMLVQANSEGKVQLPTSDKFKAYTNQTYPYKVVGWYDIREDIYYGEEMLGEWVPVSGDTVFYPDYVAQSYDIGQPTNLAEGQVDTSSFITTHVFDYNELFNLQSAEYVGDDINLTYSNNGNNSGASGLGYHSGNWKLNPSGYLGGFVLTDWIQDPASDATGNNPKDQGITSSNNGGNPGDGNLGRPFNLDANNLPQLGTRAQPTAANNPNIQNYNGIITPGLLTHSDYGSRRLNALFTTESARKDAQIITGASENNVLGREYLGTGNHLYLYDAETGYYYYDSARNGASYNKGKNRFYVYNYREAVDNESSFCDFLPLNYKLPNYEVPETGEMIAQYKERDTEVNFWFGMKSEITFYLPDTIDPSQVTGQKVFDNTVLHNGGQTDMQFRFAGDDDVWVFVDNQLVLDMGGVHDIVYGEINFATGQAKTGDGGAYNSSKDSQTLSMPGLGDQGNGSIETSSLPPLKGGQEHTLTICYMERGSSLSNCAIYFNLAKTYELELVKHDGENTENFLKGATFSFYTDEDCEEADKAELYVYDSQTGQYSQPTNSFTTGEDGKLHCWGLVPGTTYYIKETTPPLLEDGTENRYPDMSDHIIQLNLTADGKPTLIILDSDGTTWEFAKAYQYSATGHRIILDVYNNKYVGGEKEVYVEKVWKHEEEEPPANLPDITVKLYISQEGATDLDTGRKLVLNAKNNWKGVFHELPELPEGCTYTVREDPIPSGYAVEYTTTSGNVSTEGWVPVTKLTSGKKYLLVRNNGSSDDNILTTADSDLEFMRWSTEDLSELLSKKPSDIKDGIVWEATGENDYQLKTLGHNCAMWLYHGSPANIFVKNSTPTGNQFKGRVVLEEKSNKLYLYMVNGNTKYYFSNDPYTGAHGSSGSDFKSLASTSSSSDGVTTFTIYEWQETKTTTSDEKKIDGWRITNTEIPEGSYELPETGGPGAHWYILGGILLITGGTLWYRKQEHGKEGPTTS